MQVVTRCPWEVKVDDMTDLWYVEASGSQIGCHKHFSALFLVSEASEVPVTVLGRDITMQRCRLEIIFGQHVLHGSCTLHRVAEHDARCVMLTSVPLVLLHQELERLNFVEVSDVNELVLQVGQVHVCGLFYDALEGALWVIPAV